MIQLPIPFEGNEELPGIRENLLSKGMPWIKVADNAPYFITDRGEDWTPIGQNDAITWPELKGLFSRKDPQPAEAYFRMLSQHGVTCLRLMLEYCHGEHRYFEKPLGTFKPSMVRLWDDIFALCEKYGLRVLLTPYDTFWMWIRWKHHPYNKKNGGVCKKRSQWLLCRDTRAAIKQRLAFATERWGGSGALFAWDLWNEIHPAHGGDSVDGFTEFIEDISSSLRSTEIKCYGKSHLQTVSVFGPVLLQHTASEYPIFKHPKLDFASIHFYEKNTIDDPQNTIDPAISTGRLTRDAVLLAGSRRPFFDSEHGPIHAFKDKKITLPEPFDDEYFRYMQWAHFASGGAGGGMRWPNRHPHSLTSGMRKAQQSLARFLALVNWQRFKRNNLNQEIKIRTQQLVAFCCGDRQQVVLWLLSTQKNTQGLSDKSFATLPTIAVIPGLVAGNYKVTEWNTFSGSITRTYLWKHAGGPNFELPVPPITGDLAVAITRIE